MDGSKYIGIGFFGTITNEVNVNNIGVSAGTVSVSNLELRNVNVQNNTNEHKKHSDHNKWTHIRTWMACRWCS